MNRLSKFFLAGFLALIMAGPAITSGYAEDGEMEKEAGAPAYSIDTTHSTVGFAVKHLQVATTRGKFNDYDGTIHYDPDNLDAFKADLTVQVKSIDTDNEKRDQHLISGDFFAAEEFPTITFTSDRLDKRGEGYVIVGDLTIRGVTKTLTFPVQIAGPLESPFGQTVVALSAETVIDRQDFGVSWNKTMDNGGLVVDDKVTLIAEFELHQK